MTGVPMPHSPGCDGHSHQRASDQPCEAYLHERRKRQRATYTEGVCTGCGRAMRVVKRYGAPYCKTCLGNWRNEGFTGNRPPPLPDFRPSALELARENRHLLRSGWPVSAIAREIGVTERTVARWRKLLRENDGQLQPWRAAAQQETDR